MALTGQKHGPEEEPVPDSVSQPTYEEQYPRAQRWFLRLGRAIRRNARAMQSKPFRFLVEIRWRLGDEIMAIPVYEAIAARFPGAEIWVLCNFPELLDGNPYVAFAHKSDVPGRPDFYYCLRSGPRRLWRLQHYASLADVTPHDTCPHIYVESWKDAALPSDFDSEKPFITVCTGAGWQNKRWPVEYWRKLVSGLSRQGHRIVQLGTGIDERIGDPAEDWIDRTTLKQAACILRQARLMICCDSGLMHLAMAVGRPTLALFGPTNPDLYAPRNPLLTTVQGDPLCTGCWNNSPVDFRVDTCPLNRDSCLATVSPEVLMERIQRVLRTDS